MRAKETVIEKEISRKRRFKLASVDTRSTFLLVHPTIQETSKTLLTVTTVTFAGSLTFLGLKENLGSINFLKWAWALLAASVAVHLFVLVASLDSLISHGRTETEANKAKEELENGGSLLDFFKGAFSSHQDQASFFKTARLTIIFLVLQSVLVLAGGTLMAVFVWQNL